MFLPHGQGHLPQPPPNFTNEVTPRAAGKKTARRRRPAGHEREPHQQRRDQRRHEPTMRPERKRTETPFHVKPSELALALVAWTILVVLMTSLVAWWTIGHAPSDSSSPVAPAQVPHFVCTDAGDGTIQRCVYSSNAKHQP